MKANEKARRALVGCIASLLLFGSTVLAQEDQPKEAVAPECEDSLKGKATIDPKLESDFFAETKRSYPQHIVKRANGKLEDTLDGVVDEEDRIQVEHTANCVSSHQGNHVMRYCDAQLKGKNVTLTIWGGLPAYASSLKIKIDRELNLRCAFEAVYPGPSDNLAWRIKKKVVRLKDADVAKSSRLYGWISVEFEESGVVDGKMLWTPYKIEGYIKPVLEAAPAPKTNRAQGAAGQPAPAEESSTDVGK